MGRHERVSYWVHIMANTGGRAATLYTGMTNSLERRVREHQHGRGSAFTSRYQLRRLVYCEEFVYVLDAIERGKEIKGWRRARKIELIESLNPEWRDLGGGL